MKKQTSIIKRMAVQNGYSLKVLNLAYCELSLESVQNITKNCVQLTELSLADCYVSEESVDILVARMYKRFQELTSVDLLVVRMYAINSGQVGFTTHLE